MEERVRDVEAGGAKLRVEVRGAGGPVLLLHGLSANRRTWEAVARRLEGRFLLCLPDLPGRGESEARPDLPQGLGDELERLRALLEALRFVPRVVAGHSQGAALAAALAAVDPRVEGLVLANPVTPWTSRPAALSLLGAGPVRRTVGAVLVPLRRPLARRILGRVYGPDRPVTEADVERYAGPYADPRRARLLLRALAEWDPAALADRLPGRALEGCVLAGERDGRTGVGGPARLAERLGLGLAVVPRAGHALPEEAPERVARAVAAVATAVERRRSPGSAKPIEPRKPERVDRRAP